MAEVLAAVGVVVICAVVALLAIVVCATFDRWG